MAKKASLLVNHVFVTSFCRRQNREVGDISKGSTNTEHVIEIQNGSTLPYDVQVLTELPDSPPIKSSGSPSLEFAHGSLAKDVEWGASVLQLASGDTRPDVALTHCIATVAGSTRLVSNKINYRTGSGVQWQGNSTASLSIDLALK
jgi:hypothetical protein